MRRLLILIYIAIWVPKFFASAQTQGTLFPYPEAPDTMSTMDQRCSYVVEHFWDRCNLKQAFSHRARLSEAMNDYFGLMPYASAEASHKSVDALLEQMKKQPELMLGYTRIAEGLLYSDSARMSIDEIYSKFVNAVVSNKKIKSPEKARYEAQALILNNCQVGMKAPDLMITLPDGSVTHLDEINGGHIILFFNDPDCGDCAMARARLSADYNIAQFIKRGMLTVVSVYPGDDDDESWVSYRNRLPAEWIGGAAPDADRFYDLRTPPVIYYLNPGHKILSKSLTVDQLLTAFRRLNDNSTAQ